MNIRQKLIITLVTALSLNLAVVFYAIFTYKSELERTSAITNDAFRIVTDSLSTQVHFKKQVQEWKNILIRGHEPELYNKYLSQFFQQEAITRTKASALLGMLTRESDTWRITRDFVDSHIRLGEAYRKALSLFDTNAPRPHIKVDTLVRGIDREPTDLIDQVVALTNRDKAARIEQIRSELRVIELNILFFSVALLVLTVVALAWLADRIIARPIRTATAVAHRISRGELSGSIPAGGGDEAGRMLAALESMQTNLSAYQEKLHRQQSQLAGQVERRTQALNIANVELARAVKAKDFFLATMSHELRTPLTTILGLTEMLHDRLYGPINQAQQKTLETLGESAHHLLTLINDILDVAKVESGKMELNWDHLPADQLIEASLRLVRQSAMVKEHEISYRVDPAVKLIHGDGRRLKQVLVNLLDNAIKFTPAGGKIGLEVTAETLQKQVNLCVWDTGIGIEKAQQQQLFSPFVQLDSEPTRRYSGTGLGLTLVQRMTELHGGHVTVTSAPGEGSRFTVTLPWETQDKALNQRHIESSGDPKRDRKKIPVGTRVLLADDNPENLKMISDYLSLNGFQVIAANSGQDAIRLALEMKPQLLLIDVQLNDMDGLQVTRQLRQQAAFQNTPIIALTALAMPGDREKCLDAGMDTYLSKPVGLKELLSTLLNYL